MPALPLLLVATALTCSTANSSSRRSDVLRQEQHWMAAARHGDARGLKTILAREFVHTDYRGDVLDRRQTLANIGMASSYDEATSGRRVQFFGDVAVVHGINTVTRFGKPMIHLRYTDVYVRCRGQWLAVSAQETPVLRSST